MNIRTIEDNFDYQAHSIFEDMREDYEYEQAENKEAGDRVFTFAEWLWSNREELGKRFYERFDDYAGIDDETEKYNYET